MRETYFVIDKKCAKIYVAKTKHTHTKINDIRINTQFEPN